MNPILQQMGNRANLLTALLSADPQRTYEALMQNNPQFRQFVEANKGKTPEQIAGEHGIDLGQIMKFLK